MARRSWKTTAVAIPLLTLVSAASAGAQESGATLTPDGLAYLVSKDVGTERWTIAFNLSSPDGASFLNVTGNVFRSDGGPPSFLLCQVRSDSTGSLADPASTFRLSCFGTDACPTTATECAQSSWIAIDDEVLITADFFLPPGGAGMAPALRVPAAPYIPAPTLATMAPSPAVPAGTSTTRGATLTLDGFDYLVSKDIAGERWSISLSFVPAPTDQGGIVRRLTAVTGNVLRPEGGPPAFVYCTETPASTGDLNDPASEFVFACRGADACPTTAVECAAGAWSAIPGEVRLPASFFLPPLGLPAAPTSDPEIFIIGRTNGPPAIITGQFSLAEGESARTAGLACAVGLPCRAQRVGSCTEVAGTLTTLPGGTCGCRVDEVPAGCIACASLESCGGGCEYPVGDLGASARGLCLPVSADSPSCVCYASGPEGLPTQGCGGTLGVACPGSRCCAADPRDACAPSRSSGPAAAICPGVCVEPAGCDPTEDCGACFGVSAACTGDSDCAGGAYCRPPPARCGEPGACAPRPAYCTAEVQPVCGCDGVTYSNACLAAAAGVGLAGDGECVPGSCTTSSECAGGEFCQRTPGACDAVGVCSARPSICTDVLEPVCGCDGQTYGNACEAAAAGVSVAGQGSCDCEDNADCLSGSYCEKPIGACSGQGACSAVPRACTRELDPVCGCDGTTYPNPCVAAAAGVSIRFAGSCETCAENGDCASGQYCQRPDGACEAAGVCAERPTLCPLAVAPVCGCDGETYSNACEARAAGVNVVESGICLESCIEDFDCATEEFCARPPRDCFGVGTCTLPPAFCAQVFLPVCGCDGETYSNECAAQANRVNVASEGSCP